MIFQLFSDEQRRLLANLAQYYDAYMEAERAKLEAGNCPLHWKTVNGRQYLYQIIDSRGNAKSLGPRSETTATLYEKWHGARERSDNAKTALMEIGRMYRSLRLGTLSAEAASILREAALILPQSYPRSYCRIWKIGGPPRQAALTRRVGNRLMAVQ